MMGNITIQGETINEVAEVLLAKTIKQNPLGYIKELSEAVTELRERLKFIDVFINESEAKSRRKQALKELRLEYIGDIELWKMALEKANESDI